MNLFNFYNQKKSSFSQPQKDRIFNKERGKLTAANATGMPQQQVGTAKSLSGDTTSAVLARPDVTSGRASVDPKDRTLTVSIVNWNSAGLLTKCLEALYKCLPKQMNYEIIIIDNASTDNSVSLIKEKFSGINIIKNLDNLGFGTAHNKVIKIAQGEYILFLNTDVILIEGVIEQLINFMDKNPNAGLCSPGLLNANGKKQETGITFPSLLTEFFGRAGFKEKDSPYKVDAVRGACMLARADVIKKLGGFSERYFLFLEETDLCLRIHKTGYEVWCLPCINVTHIGGGSAESIKIGSRIEYWRARYIFFRENYSFLSYLALNAGLSVKLILDCIGNFLAVIFTLALNKKFKNKLNMYLKIFLWHIFGKPCNWGINSQNIIKANDWKVRREFQDWWNLNRDLILSKKGDVVLVKENSSRKIFTYNNEVYVKAYKTCSFFKKPWINEWNTINRIRQFNIPTVMPVAMEERYLVTKKLDNVQPLHDFFLKNKDKFKYQEKNDLIKLLAGFINKLHVRGVFHKDLHAGNILVGKQDNEYKFYIIDLHRAKLVSHLSRGQVINNLVQLNKFFSLYLSSSDRLRFFKYYTAETFFERWYKKYAKIISKKTKDACFDLWGKRDKLYLKKNKYGIRGKFNGVRYIVNPAPSHPGSNLLGFLPQGTPPKAESQWDVERRGGINQADKGIDINVVMNCVKNHAGDIIKDSRSSFVSRVNIDEIGRVVLKIYRQKKFINYIKDMFRKSRGLKAWCGSWALITRGLNTPEPVAAGERRRFGIVKESFIITKEIPESTNLTLFVKDKNKEQINFISRKVSSYTRALHDRGIFPLDMKGSNIIVKGSENNSEIFLIDLDHIKTGRKICLNKRLYNILQIKKSTGLLCVSALPVRRILIVKPSAFGDIIQSLSAAGMLRKEFNGASIWWLANNNYTEFLKLIPSIDKVVSFERYRWGKAWNIFKTIPEIFMFIANIRRKKFDIVLDLQGLFRSGIITWLSGAPVRIGFGDTRDFAYLFYNNKVYLKKDILHAQERYFYLTGQIADIGNPAHLFNPPSSATFSDEVSVHLWRDLASPRRTRFSPSFNISETVKEWADKTWGEKNIRIAVNPGGRWSTKRWPAENYAELINKISTKWPAKIIILGDKNDESVAENITGDVNQEVINLSGKTDLIQLTALLSKSDLLITNDSGTMHLADYLGIPIIALFGPTDPRRTGPKGKDAIIIKSDIKCSPCFKRLCDETKCMKSIDVNTVISAVEDILKKPRSVV